MPAAELSIRRADLGTVDLAARTVPVTIATTTPVQRMGFLEVLDIARVDLSRGDLPLIEGHDTSRVNVGVVRGLRVDGERLRGEAVFGTSARAAELLADVQAGIVTGVSVGYRLTDDGRQIELPDGRVALAFAFMPHEVSIVPVPADTNAGFFRSLPAPGVPSMSSVTNAPATVDRAAVDASIRSLADRHGLHDFAAGLVAAGASLDQARGAILDELARRDQAAGGHRNIAGGRFQRETEAHDARQRMVDALSARLGARVDIAGNPYRHVGVSEMARELLELRGIRTTDLSPDRLIERALHGTADFPELLTSAGNRVLRVGYTSYSGGIRRACRPSLARDFRAKQALQLGEAPTLLQVNEHGEFKAGTMAEAKTSYALATYGRIFGITRQALVNDDLDAFGSMTLKLGQAAAEFEAKFLVDLLASNPTMNDSTALFHADHGNLGTGAGSVLSFDALSNARKAMRLQKGLDKATPIDVTPRFLIVPAALESTALQLTSTAYQPAQQSDINPMAGLLEVVVDPRLDAKSATAWYLAADPGAIDTIEYSYLEGAGGPEMFSREGFEVDGVEMKVRLDFGAGVLDWRGLYKANGA